jgi:TonB-dependent receptor
MSRKTRRNAAKNASRGLQSPVIFRAGHARVGLTGLAALGSLAYAGSLLAAETTDTANSAIEEVVVTGMRASLKNSQALKKDSDVVQDSISAQDIGELPDRSVTEALARVPGVAINQFAAGVDPDHFSVEGSGVTVRGLDSRTRSELNGRDTFTANNGRALSFADVPPELLVGVDVFKSPSAEMIEGGIAGTVNLRTRVPFDSAKRILSASAEYNYGDFDKKGKGSFSGLYSDQWDTGNGAFGLLVNLVDSKLNSRADGTQVSNFGCRSNLTDSSGNAITNPGVLCPVNPAPGVAQQPGIFFPRGAAFRTQDFDRERKGMAGALQWKNPNDSFLATAQFLRSDSTEAWTEHAVEIATDNVAGSATDSYPDPGTTFGVAPSGVFTDGSITTQTGYRADQWGGAAHRVPFSGLQSNNISRAVDQEFITQDASLNLRWNITDRLTSKLDLQHVKSSVDNHDDGIWASTFQDLTLAVNGSSPDVFTFQPIFNVNNPTTTNCTVPVANGANNCSNYLSAAHPSYSDPYNSFWRSAMDHIEQSDGTEKAAALNFDFKVGDGFARSVDFGVRWADRNETTRFSTYNWGVMSEIWGNNGPVWLDNPGIAAQYQTFTFNNFARGQVPVPTGSQPLLFYTGNGATNYQSYSAFAESVVNAWLTQGGGSAITGCGSSGSQGWVPLADRCNVIPGTPFLAGEINPVDEKNKAAYLQLNFRHDFGEHRFSGNIGVRYTKTDRVADGFVTLPNPGAVQSAAQCAAVVAGAVPPPFCQITNAAYVAAIRAFANGSTNPLNSAFDYNYFLPSLNAKFELNKELVGRVSLSRTVTPPQIGYVRGDYTLSGFLPMLVDSTGHVPLNADGTPVNPLRTSGTFGNPLLRPESSDNLDLSLEWYFSPVGSLTGAVFFKRVHDVVVNNTTAIPFTNAGATVDAVVTQPGNSPDTGKIAGFEFGYQQTYDFLPKPLDGLGLAFNYTYIDSDGVQQSTLSSTDPDVGAGRVTNINISLLPLQGLSKQTYNITAFYDKGAIDARVAWSWRSNFLLTTRDVIVPYAPIMNENTGQLDASAFFNVTSQVKVGLQAVNLLNNITKTSQILDNQLLRAPRSFFMEDRRISLIMRATF